MSYDPAGVDVRFCGYADGAPYAGNCNTYEDGVEWEGRRDIINTPCCNAGAGCECDRIAGDMPWLKPKAIACGRSDNVGLIWAFQLYDGELDGGALPGRPKHTIVSIKSAPAVRVSASVDDEYDIMFCVVIPVQIIIRDCSGFSYCLHSEYTEVVRVPMCGKVCGHELGTNMMAYVKTRTRLVKDPGPFDGSNLTGGPVLHPNACGNTNVDGSKYLPQVTVASLVEICVVRLLPYATAS